MEFNKKENAIKLGEKIGFILMYLVFTTLLYFFLKFLNKIPDWNYFHVALLTLAITLTGILIKKVLNN